MHHYHYYLLAPGDAQIPVEEEEKQQTETTLRAQPRRSADLGSNAGPWSRRFSSSSSSLQPGSVFLCTSSRETGRGGGGFSTPAVSSPAFPSSCTGGARPNGSGSAAPPQEEEASAGRLPSALPCPRAGLACFALRLRSLPCPLAKKPHARHNRLQSAQQQQQGRSSS